MRENNRKHFVVVGRFVTGCLDQRSPGLHLYPTAIHLFINSNVALGARDFEVFTIFKNNAFVVIAKGEFLSDI